ncbi:unnamed protein product [Protopolystoma xenopodis]|uniref:Uncharacterized protein n=1 Tax=Protopolystoma xenopodis TaxID=117903 RepID=A0A448WXQ8_9PLAT|nr:unnamed protein product [Protopolystoma xenopodis]
MYISSRLFPFDVALAVSPTPQHARQPSASSGASGCAAFSSSSRSSSQARSMDRHNPRRKTQPITLDDLARANLRVLGGLEGSTLGENAGLKKAPQLV